MDYEFHILDNPFLVHKPGIKRPKLDKRRAFLVLRQDAVIRNSITPELQVVYGKKASCLP